MTGSADLPEPAGAAPGGAPRPRHVRRLLIAFAVALAILLLCQGALNHQGLTLRLLGISPPSVHLPTELEQASATCSAGKLSHDGNELFLDTAGTRSHSGKLRRSHVLCVLRALSAPAYLLTGLGEANPDPGEHGASWSRDGDAGSPRGSSQRRYTADWSYQPSDGLDVTIRAGSTYPDANIGPVIVGH